MKHDHPDSADPRPEHLRAWEALPWVVNGRATPEQARWVADHVAGCEDCRAELAWQQRLHDALATPADAAAASSAADPAAEAGLQRLLARLDDAVEEQPATASPPIAAPVRSHRLTWALAAAVVVQAIGLGVMSLQLGSNGDTSYRTLSEGPGPSAPAATLRVLPDSTMTLAQWQALLQALDLQVVSGPNASGAYALAPTPSATALPREGALARLRASPGIRLAEPIGTAP
jgi:hypothetical protein